MTDLAAVRSGGKAGLARALSRIECEAGSRDLADLLDTAWRQARAHVLGVTGPPGVGKSTLVDALIRHWREAGESVGVIAVDPSSQRSGGALLGDRTRLKTDPADAGVFVRSMAARDRLGGLSDHAIAATVLMRAIFERVIVETVGIGQSEADITLVADTVLLCLQPASGDALQFMKAGVMELPDIVAVTKADMGAAAQRAQGDAESALALVAAAPGEWTPTVTPIAAVTGEGLPALLGEIERHRVWAEKSGTREMRRRGQAGAWIREAVRSQYGKRGVAAVDIEAALAGAGPFAAENILLAELEKRLRR